MIVTWKNNAGTTLHASVPKRVRPYVEAIGFEAAVMLMLAVGGVSVYLPSRFTSSRHMLHGVLPPEARGWHR